MAFSPNGKMAVRALLERSDARPMMSAAEWMAEQMALADSHQLFVRAMKRRDAPTVENTIAAFAMFHESRLNRTLRGIQS